MRHFNTGTPNAVNLKRLLLYVTPVQESKELRDLNFVPIKRITKYAPPCRLRHDADYDAPVIRTRLAIVWEPGGVLFVVPCEQWLEHSRTLSQGSRKWEALGSAGMSLAEIDLIGKFDDLSGLRKWLNRAK